MYNINSGIINRINLKVVNEIIIIVPKNCIKLITNIRKEEGKTLSKTFISLNIKFYKKNH